MSTALPLSVALMIAIVKKTLEDRRRKQQDKIENHRLCRVINLSGQKEEKQWKNIVPGDILYLALDEEVPADIVILASSEEEGRCYVNTSSLDGETNLKYRVAAKGVCQSIGFRNVNQGAFDEETHIENAIALKGEIEFEQPHEDLYNFMGVIRFAHSNRPCPLDPSNLILRGSFLSGCEYIFGFVVYTGLETKIMKNAARFSAPKQSKVYRVVDKFILVIVGLQFTLCIISIIFDVQWLKAHSDQFWYLPYIKETTTDDIISAFFTFLILYNNLVPISLYVSLDMIKAFQARRIVEDESLVHDFIPPVVRNSDLNEDLGQVQYIFSDKTGTLTQNSLEFKKCSVGGKIYGEIPSSLDRASARRESLFENLKQAQGAQVHHNPAIQFNDPALLRDLNSEPRKQALDAFLTHLAICHTVIPEEDYDTGDIFWRSASQDEEALVKAAQCFGYALKSAAPKLELQVTTSANESSTRKFNVLNINEFSSSRKRMSVIVRDSDNKLFLYCKGADSTMIKRGQTPNALTLIKHIQAFAEEGLRILVLGIRELDEEEYAEWEKFYRRAASSLVNRETRLDEAADLIESNLIILGATGVEDKLQPGVQAAIRKLREADIRIWTLTGDREEAMVNIAFSCLLLRPEYKVFYLNADSKEEIMEQLNRMLRIPQVEAQLKRGGVANDLALVCDGNSLIHILNSLHAKNKSGTSPETSMALKFFKIASCCCSVLVCRVAPALKAGIITFVRRMAMGNPVTLAIGDGANDVNMLQAAHVGVGIIGKEGNQAINNSDYGLAQFKFLLPLLLLHGRSNYQRISKVVLYSFAKNVALVSVFFFFNFFTGFSGTLVFESVTVIGWNFFLALPIIAIGIYDTDIVDQVVLQNPRLYGSGQRNEKLNSQVFLGAMIQACVAGLVSFLIPTFTMHTAVAPAGYAIDFRFYGTIAYCCVLMSMNLKIIILTKSWTMYNYMGCSFSITLYFLFLLVYPFLTMISWELYGVIGPVLSSGLFWLIFLLVPLSGVLADWTLKAWKTLVRPTPADILRESMYSHQYKVCDVNSRRRRSNVPMDQENDNDGELTLGRSGGFVFNMAESKVTTRGRKNGSIGSIAAARVEKRETRRFSDDRVLPRKDTFPSASFSRSRRCTLALPRVSSRTSSNSFL